MARVSHFSARFSVMHLLSTIFAAEANGLHINDSSYGFGYKQAIRIGDPASGRVNEFSLHIDKSLVLPLHAFDVSVTNELGGLINREALFFVGSLVTGDEFVTLMKSANAVSDDILDLFSGPNKNKDPAATDGEPTFELQIARAWDMSSRFRDLLIALVSTRLQLVFNRLDVETVAKAATLGAVFRSNTSRVKSTTRYYPAGSSSGDYIDDYYVTVNILIDCSNPVLVGNSAASAAANLSGIIPFGQKSLIDNNYFNEVNGQLGVWFYATHSQIPGSGQGKIVVETMRAVMEGMR